MKRDPIWITGLGAVTPLGCSYSEISENLLAGVSGVRRIDAFDVRDHPAQIGATVGDIPCPPGWNAADFSALLKLDRAALACCAAALHDAGWWTRRAEVRIGLVLGTAAEWCTCWAVDGLAGGDQVYRPHAEAETLTRRTARRLSLNGPAVSLSAACASGNYAIAIARRWLQLGWVDVCLAGACDLAITPVTLAGFGNLRALSRRNEQPEAASRPFDVDRDGFVMGDGGAMFVLERAASARRRGVRVYAEVAGCGAAANATHWLKPQPDGRALTLAMNKAIADAKLSPDRVDFVNAFGSGAVDYDLSEAAAIRATLGTRGIKTPVITTRGALGNNGAGSGAIDLAVSVYALHRGVLPPSVNTAELDPACGINVVRNDPIDAKADAALSIATAMSGGQTAAIAIRRYHE